MTADDDPDRAANRRGLKVHLRVVALGATTYRVVSLRPSTRARFSTNHFHGAWHVITGSGGAAVLGRLLWGLAFQRQPQTLVWLDAPHVTSTPFDGDRAEPIAIIPAGVTGFVPAHLRALRDRLPGVASTATIRWHTFGLPEALAAERLWSPWRHRPRATFAREQMSRTLGVVCYTAPPALLRAHGADVYAMRRARRGSYLPLAEHRVPGVWGPEGEVQVIPHFDDDVAAAAVARREVLGSGVDPTRPIDANDREAIWGHLAVVQARRARARSRPPGA